jgi:hypothetical protein
VLTQYGWFWLSQRSDAKSPGASAPGLLFMRGGPATVSGVRFFSMEPVATDDVFGADLGASPVAVRNPGPEKVMKPRMISLRRGFFISPVATRFCCIVSSDMPFNYTLFKYSDRRELARTHALNDEDAIARLSEEARIPPLEPCGDDPSAEFYVDRSDPNAPRDQPVRIWLKRRVS